MKHPLATSLRLLAIAAVAVVPLLASNQASAALNYDASISLSPGSASVTKGGAVNYTISVNRGSNQVNTWRIYLTYPTNLFSGGSMTLTGSPFNVVFDNTVGGGGALLTITSFAGASANTYSGAVATLTLNSIAAGSGTIAVGPKCPDGQVDNCNQALSVPDLTNTTAENVLISSAGYGASVTVNNPPTSGGGGTTTGGGTTGGTTTGSKGGTTTPKPGTTTTPKPGTTTPTTTTPTPTNTTTTPTTTTTDTTTDDVSDGSASVTLTLKDQSGKPVSGAKVTVDGVTGTTDKNGKVTLAGVSPGSVTGKVTYKGETKSISLNVKDGNVQPTQSASVTIKVKKTSAAAPIAITVGTLAVVAGVGYVLAGPGGGLGSLMSKFGSGGPKPTVPTSGAGPTPTPPTPPAPTPQASATTTTEPAKPKSGLPKHLDPMAPGTTFTPSKTF